MRVLHELAPRSPSLCARPASPALDGGSVVAAAEAAAGAAAPLFPQDLLLPFAVVPSAPSAPACLESWHGPCVGQRALGAGTREGLPELVSAPPTSDLLGSRLGDGKLGRCSLQPISNCLDADDG